VLDGCYEIIKEAESAKRRRTVRPAFIGSIKPRVVGKSVAHSGVYTQP